MVDINKILDDYLSDPTSLEVFSDPYIINCGHPIDKTTLIALNVLNDKGEIASKEKLCPLCREQITQVIRIPFLLQLAQEFQSKTDVNDTSSTIHRLWHNVYSMITVERVIDASTALSFALGLFSTAKSTDHMAQAIFEGTLFAASFAGLANLMGSLVHISAGNKYDAAKRLLIGSLLTSVVNSQREMMTLQQKKSTESTALICDFYSHENLCSDEYELCKKEAKNCLENTSELSLMECKALIRPSIQACKLKVSTYRPIATGVFNEHPVILDLASKYKITPQELIYTWFQKQNLKVLPKQLLPKEEIKKTKMTRLEFSLKDFDEIKWLIETHKKECLPTGCQIFEK